MTRPSPGSIAAIIDHTLLRPEATTVEIVRLCQEATAYGFAAVCVNPYWVELASGLLSGRSTKVCAVIGFPFGATTADVKVYEARRALLDGAREADMVINVGALKSGHLEAVEHEIAAVVEVCRDHQAVKVILETGFLTDEEKVAACKAAQAAGADYVKTSTGFGPGGATAVDVALMRRTVGERMGIKAAGGIRDLPGLQSMVAAGATRIGTSAGVRIVEEASRAL